MSIADVAVLGGEMPLERLEAEITELAGHLAAGECRWLLLVGEYDRRKGYESWGCHSIVQWLGWHCGLNTRAARERVRVAHCLEVLPAISEQFSLGKISYSKTRALTRVATPKNEADLLMISEHATASQVERVVRSYRSVLSNEEERQENNVSHAKRYLRIDPCDDGSFVINGRLQGETAKILIKALEAALEETNQEQEPVDKSGPAGPFEVNLSTKQRENKSLATSNADALVMLAESFLANGPNARNGGDRYQIVLNVDSEMLSDQAEDQTCELDDGTSLSRETARRLSCDASVVVFINDEDGQPQQVGKKTRTIPPSTRRGVNLRDQGCRFPGCGARKYIDVHHIKHWAHGGTHEMANLIQLCWHHHRLIHEGGWNLEVDEQGQLQAIKPDGTKVTTNENLSKCLDHQKIDSRSIERANKANGLSIDPNTCITKWCGDRLDLDLIMSGLWQVDHPPEEW